MPLVKELFEKMELNDDQIEKPIIVQWLSKHGCAVTSFIAGIAYPSGEKVKISTPCGLEYEAVCGSEQLVHEALQSAATAQQKWRVMNPEAKTRVIYAVARNFQKHVTLFGTAEAVTFPFKRLERCRGACATYTIEYLYNAAARRNFSDTPARYSAMLVLQTSEFCPVNLVAEWQIGEALSAHTPVVLAVSIVNCLPALIFAEICNTAGLPTGLLNVVILSASALASLRPSSDVMLLQLRETRRHVSTCIIAEGADIGSAVNGAMEMLSDYWGMVKKTFSAPNYLGGVVYVQDCMHSRVIKVLEAQVDTLKVAKSNFAKTVDLVADARPRVIKQAHIHIETAPKEPTIFVQGFRTIKEVAALASAGPLHSECLSVWTEYVGRAVEIADRVSGFRHIWINGHNWFDIDIASLKQWHFPSGKADLSEKVHHTVEAIPDVHVEHIPSNVDHTLKLYYGGGQKCAESQTCYPVYNRFPPFDRGDKIVGYVSAAGPKDARNAVEAALKAFSGWRSKSAFSRSQVIYFLGENLSQRRVDFIEKLLLNTGHSDCAQELQESIDATFKWAGYCDNTAPSFTSSSGMKVYSSFEPHGVVAIVCPPVKTMRSLVTLMVSVISIGNTAVVVVPEEYPIAPLTLAEVL
ncbi:aldehyde dehydrogenase family 16 member A1-like [Tropilaelaps mercedesae]|uniref:Aldehyde dehydrogenase family 16 member A1-like n=1 Tax=Tropilaelaps mercedesae TaxID=418985 RepID=A0A1V9XD46_9ACAR|nr:aldehyde dehydrogenase family 16 member A1-like [Tropilaelaps mercedesae]